MTAAEVAAKLDVSKRTVYAYASRGLLGSHRGPGLEALYDRSAVERLSQRALARKGHGVAAAGALRWGEPVLQTALTELVAEGPRYRGVLATSVTDRPFESVARFFWSGMMEEARPFAHVNTRTRQHTQKEKTRPSVDVSLHDRLLHNLLSLPLPRHAQVDAAEWLSGEQIIASFATAIRVPPKRGGLLAEGLSFEASQSAARNRERAELVNLALVLMLDHELNASTFAARTAAGVGASLVHSIAAGLCTLAGPRHGAACDRIEHFLTDVAPNGVLPKTRAMAALEPLEGFFCPPCYPNGDPRAAAILSRLQDSTFAKRAPKAIAYSRAGAQLGLGKASVDLALVALTEALALSPGMASAIFAIARTAGFVGHILEQRKTGPIRPRAGYRLPQTQASES